MSSYRFVTAMQGAGETAQEQYANRAILRWRDVTTGTKEMAVALFVEFVLAYPSGNMFMFHPIPFEREFGEGNGQIDLDRSGDRVA